MSTVTVDWHDEQKRILRYRFLGAWRWEDYFDAITVGRPMMRAQKNWVCIFNDMLETSYVPVNFLNRARDVITTRPENTGLVVFVSHSTTFRSVYQAFIRLYPHLEPGYKLERTEAGALLRFKAWLEQAPPFTISEIPK